MRRSLQRVHQRVRDHLRRLGEPVAAPARDGTAGDRRDARPEGAVEPFQPVRRRDAVVVDEADDDARGGVDPGVTCRGGTGARLSQHGGSPGGGCFDRGRLARAVVDNVHLVRDRRHLCSERREAASERLRAVVRRHDHRDRSPLAGHMRRRARMCPTVSSRCVIGSTTRKALGTPEVLARRGSVPLSPTFPATHPSRPGGRRFESA